MCSSIGVSYIGTGTLVVVGLTMISSYVGVTTASVLYRFDNIIIHKK